jgi:hypothetical protein
MCVQSIYVKQTREIRHQSIGFCDAKTFYCCNFQVYLGSTGNDPERNQGARVVKDSASFWKNSGRNVTTDNFYRHFLSGRSFENQYYSSRDNAKNAERPAEIVGADGKSSYVFIAVSF